MVAAVEVERWRSYFGKAGADIWTVIQQAISIAAMDHPKDFRERRGEIAETLFARSLVMVHARDAQDNLNAHMSTARRPQTLLPTHVQSTPAHEEGELTESETLACHMSRRMSFDVICNGTADHDDAAHVQYHDEAEALPDELEKETLLIRDLDDVKATIMDGDQPEAVVLDVLQGLQHMHITVGALKATEIGKHVNCLRKHPSKRVRALVKEVVRQWKVLVDEWVSSEGDVAAATATYATARDPGDRVAACDHEEGLVSPPLDEAARVDDIVPSVDLSQLFSFMHGDVCKENKGSHKLSSSLEPSVKDNLNYLSRSLSGSMLTDSSDIDTKVSTNHPWGHGTPEERGSATRDVYPPSGKLEKNESAVKGQTGQKVQKCSNNELELPVSKGITNGSGPGRPCNEALKGKLVQGGKAISNHNGVSRSHFVHKTMPAHVGSGDKLSNTKCDKNQVDQKLEIAKRKLHQGYQQAENAKKQRTIQVLSFPDLPKAGHPPVKGKVNQPVQNKAVPPLQSRTAFQIGHGSQSRRMA